MSGSQRHRTDHIDTHIKKQTNPSRKNQVQRVEVEPVLDQRSVEEASHPGSLDGQAELLSNPQFRTAQRQSFAGQIGQAQGNRHLGQVLSAVVQREGETAHRTVRYGSRGPDVAEAQGKLNAAGAAPPLAEDSIFGPLTRRATIEFQTGHDLAPDGVIGPLTWAALDAGETGTDTDEDDTGGETPVERFTAEDFIRLSNQASGTGPLTVYQASRAELRVLALSEGEYTTFRGLLDQAASDVEWAFLLKAAAAQRSIDDISIFADRIRGMTERWLMRNLMAVDLTSDLTEGEADPEERGIMQQYGNSCGPTSMQLVHAQADPIYALELRSAGPIDEASDNAVSDPSSIHNEQLADEQADVLNAHAAEGTGNAPSDRSAGGGGAWVEEDINAMSSTTGVSYTTQIIGTAITMDDAITALQNGLDNGVQVPIIVGGGTGPTHTSHYVVVMARSGERFLVHDVWSGDTVWRDETEFRNNTLHLPSGWNFFVAIDVPALVPAALPEPAAAAGG